MYNNSLKGRDFLTLLDYSKEEIEYLLSLSKSLKVEKKSGNPAKKYLKDKNIALIFEKPSTRTRCAFSVACSDEGAHGEYLGANDMQLGHKESIEDTARILASYYDGIEYRGFSHAKVMKLAKYSKVPVWNGLTDQFHPTQILADMLTIKEAFGKLEGINMTYIGDGRNNMANSLLIGATKLGVNITILAPSSLWPEEVLIKQCQSFADKSGSKIQLLEQIDMGVKSADVLYTDVWCSMGEEEKAAERIKLLKPYQINDEIMSKVSEETIVMHCLPAVKGNEITEKVFENHAETIFRQGENRMHTIKAVMVATIGEAL